MIKIPQIPSNLMANTVSIVRNNKIAAYSAVGLGLITTGAVCGPTYITPETVRTVGDLLPPFCSLGGSVLGLFAGLEIADRIYDRSAPIDFDYDLMTNLMVLGTTVGFTAGTMGGFLVGESLRLGLLAFLG